MIVYCPVSYGELIDKLSILRIKHAKIQDLDKQEFIKSEIIALEKEVSKLPFDFSSLMSELEMVNECLWNLEDEIRKEVQENQENFLKVAKDIAIMNDKRFMIKNRINQDFGSELCEVKGHVEN